MFKRRRPGDPPAPRVALDSLSPDPLSPPAPRSRSTARPGSRSRAPDAAAFTWVNSVIAARRIDAPIYVGLIEATVREDATASLADFVFSEHARRGDGSEAAGIVVDHLRRALLVPAVRANIDSRGQPRSAW